MHHDDSNQIKAWKNAVRRDWGKHGSVGSERRLDLADEFYDAFNLVVYIILMLFEFYRFNK